MTVVLVACRGSVAVRVIAACHRRGFSAVAVTVLGDQQRAHAELADRCVELSSGGDGANAGYESVAGVVAAAEASGATMVHPGAGALAEDPELVARLAALGIGYVGSDAAGLRMANHKDRAVAAAARIGIPVLPHATTTQGLAALRRDVGFPLVVKPVRGSMGRGVQVTRDQDALDAAVGAYPSGQGWYAERCVEHGLNVAVTVAVDAYGQVAVLGERETLLLAGSLKLVDGSPVTGLPASRVERLRVDACRLSTSMGLRGVVTCEFIVDAASHYLLEVNPRLAGGYRMCELQTGTDLLALQLDLASGAPLDLKSPAVVDAPQCLEARWYLRPPQPRSNPVTEIAFPAVAGVSHDCAIRPGGSVQYDVLLAQLLATAPTRPDAASRLVQATAASTTGRLAHYGHDIAAWLGANHSGALVATTQLKDEW